MSWFENRYGNRLWYEEKGEGQPLLLIHGWCMSSAVWRFQLDSLASKFRVIAPDLGGHGRSPQTAGCSLQRISDDIADLIHSLMLCNVILAGWSLGALASLNVFPAVCDLLAGMVLTGGTPCFVSSDDYPHGVAETEINGMELKIRRNSERAVSGFRTALFEAGEITDQNHAAMVADIITAIPIPSSEAILEALSALRNSDLRNGLEAVSSPVLLIHGDRDAICPPGASSYISSRVKGSELHIIPGVGHAPFLSRPDFVNRLILDFAGALP